MPDKIGNYCGVCGKYCFDEEYCEPCKDIVNVPVYERSNWINHEGCCGLFSVVDNSKSDLKCNECEMGLKEYIKGKQSLIDNVVDVAREGCNPHTAWHEGYNKAMRTIKKTLREAVK